MKSKFAKDYYGSLDYADADIHIGNRSDALELLDEMIKADGLMNYEVALKALRDAIKREVI